MTDPRPLIEETTDELERALLREARDVGASPELRRSTLAALGLGAPVPTPPRLLRAGALKILGASLILGVGVAAYFASHREASRPVVPSSSAPTALLAPPPPPILPASIAPPPEAAPPPSVAIASVRPHASAPPPKPSAASSLTIETTLIDRARQALYAGDKEAALRALDDYDSRFPAGVLAPEAKRLRARVGALP